MSGARIRGGIVVLMVVIAIVLLAFVDLIRPDSFLADFLNFDRDPSQRGMERIFDALQGDRPDRPVAPPGR